MLLAVLRICLVASLCSASLLADQAAGAGVDQLDQPALQEAFTALKSGYIRQDAFSYDEINRAALDGLLRRLQFGAELVPAERARVETESPAPQFHAETLSPGVGYLRFQTFGTEEAALLDGHLKEFEASARTLILDLRVRGEQRDLEAAARLLDRFVNPNTILFKVQRPKEDRPRLFVSQVTDVRWKGDLVLLIDPECSVSAELMAAVLSRERGAFLVGSPTLGRTVEFEEIPLTKAVHLRFAVAEIVLGDGTSLFGKGLQPHFPVRTDAARKRQVFAASAHTPLKGFLLDRARPRMNEAALVQETDPELDYYVARSRGERTPYDQVPLQDETLQRALDLLTTLEFVKRQPAPEQAAP